MKRFGEDSYSQFLHKLKDVQNEAEFHKDSASVASRPVNQNGGSNCSLEESMHILRIAITVGISQG